MADPLERRKVFFGLFLLGIGGGLLLEAGDHLMRVWGQEWGMTPRNLDSIGALEVVSGLRFLWAPLFAFAWTRKKWMILSLFFAILGFLGLSFFPSWGGLFFGSFLLITLGRSSFDMLVVACQMEAVPQAWWGMATNCCVNGYHVGIMMAGSGLLWLSQWYSWSWIMALLGALMGLLCLVVIFSFRFLEMPQKRESRQNRGTSLDAVDEKGSVWGFFYPWIPKKAMLLLMMTYGMPEGWIDPQLNGFLLVSGWSKAQVSLWKVAALLMSVGGGFLAGRTLTRWGGHGVLRIGLWIRGFTGGLLLCHSLFGFETSGLLLLIDQGVHGFALISFYSFQLLSCQREHALSQLAFLVSLAELGTKIASLGSGWILETLGWSGLLGAAALSNLALFIILPQKPLITRK